MLGIRCDWDPSRRGTEALKARWPVSGLALWVGKLSAVDGNGGVLFHDSGCWEGRGRLGTSRDSVDQECWKRLGRVTQHGPVIGGELG